jgi:hypothetical protein
MKTAAFFCRFVAYLVVARVLALKLSICVLLGCHISPLSGQLS